MRCALMRILFFHSGFILVMQKWREAGPTEQAELKRQMEQHYDHHRKEREYYHHRRTLARQNPTLVLHGIMDGAGGTEVPHFASRDVPRETERKPDVHVQISGAIHHSDEPQRPHVFLSFKHMYTHGMNYMCSLVCRWLELKHEECLAGNKSLPPILVLQLDSGPISTNSFFNNNALTNIFALHAGSENKNWALLTLFALLVLLKLFRTVYIFYLVPGHTHEDIDQLFSVIMSLLKDEEFLAADLEIIIHLLQEHKSVKSHQGRNYHQMKAHDLSSHMRDFEKWFEPVKASLEGFSDVHALKFEMLDETAVCFYKTWSTMPGAWKEPVPILSRVPSGEPPVCTPHPFPVSKKVALDQFYKDNWLSRVEYQSFARLWSTSNRGIPAAPFRLKAIAAHWRSDPTRQVLMQHPSMEDLEQVPSRFLLNPETESRLKPSLFRADKPPVGCTVFYFSNRPVSSSYLMLLLLVQTAATLLTEDNSFCSKPSKVLLPLFQLRHHWIEFCEQIVRFSCNHMSKRR